MINIFYSKYSDYSFSQLGNDMYKKAIESFFKKAQDNEDIRNKLKRILYEGGYDDFTVNSDLANKDKPEYEINRRLNFAGLLISDPETFETIAKNNVILFHGTNSNALPDILKEGMQSESEIIKSGKEVLTGEFSPIQPRGFISFTSQFSLALNYAKLKPSTKTNSKQSFGAFIGISTNDLNEDNNELSTVWSDSNMPEVGIKKHLPAKYIRVIAVPSSKIGEVSEMIKQYGLEQIDVVPAEGIVNAVALTESCYYGKSNISDPNCLIINGSANNKEFKWDDVRDLTQDRRIRGIRKLYLQLRDKILKKDKEMDSYVSRDE